jgi:acyl carrier protein
VPSVLAMLEEMPLTPNGKIDRAALPDPEGERPTLETEYITPRNEIERTIANIWQHILQLERVGIHDNFFDLGGHSLLMLQVHGELTKVLSAEITVIDLFEHSTVASLAEHLSGGGGSERSNPESGYERAEIRRNLRHRQNRPQ